MATTTPNALWSPDLATAFVPVTDLAHMQDTVQTALNDKPINYRTGLDSARVTPVGWTPTEGVKYYSTDTNREWFYDGTTWLSNDPGMYLLRPSSVSGATIAADGTVNLSSGTASIQVNGVFSSRFRRYKVIGNLIPGSQSYLSFQLSAGGTPFTGSLYGQQDMVMNGTSAVAAFSGAGGSLAIGRNLGTEHIMEMTVMNPQATVRTLINGDTGAYVAGKTIYSGYLATTSAYDGFTVIATGATSVTGGNIAIYGLV